MATWVLSSNRKLNLDRASWIDRSDNGDVHVVFDGALNHTFRGEAADNVWKLVAAKNIDPVATASTDGQGRSSKSRRRAERVSPKGRK